MGRREAEEVSRKFRFTMCDRKRKMKSNEASFYANKLGQRKYECPICGGWHLTKKK